MGIYHLQDGAVTSVWEHLIFFVLGYTSLRIVYLLWMHPLSDVPGPKIAALTDLWKTRAVLRKCFASTLHEQHAKYGDVVRIGPNEVSIISPEDVRSLYGQKTEFKKGPFYDAWSIVGKSLFSDRNEVTHGISRRAVSAAYSISYLTSLERYCESCTELLFRHFDKAAECCSVIDISKLIEWYSYDCVSGIAFGKHFGLLENGRDVNDLLGIFAQGTEAMVTAGTLTNFGWMLPSKPVAILTSAILGQRGPNFLIDYSFGVLKERQRIRDTDPITYTGGRDMLYRFLESKNPVTSQPLDTQALVMNTGTIIVAGADTTKIVMLAFIRQVYSHPVSLERIRREISDAISAGHVSFPIAYSQATRLEFTWACMKEAMRLHPVVGMTLQRVVPAGGCVISGRFYRAGTLVGMAARELHYDPRAYGKDAGEWRPERWLEGERNDLEKFNLAFGLGSRVCLGKNISLMEMSKLLPTIIYHYDIAIKDPETPWKVRESWFVHPYDFFCSITKREI